MRQRERERGAGQGKTAWLGKSAEGLHHLQALPHWLPAVTLPRVVKKYAISSCRRRFLSSASFLACSEFLSFFSSAVCFFFCLTSSPSSLVASFLNSALASSILKVKRERELVAWSRCILNSCVTRMPEQVSKVTADFGLKRC